MDRKVKIINEDVTSGSGSYYSAGDIITVKDLLYSMMLPSSNTASTAIGRCAAMKYVGLNSVLE